MLLIVFFALYSAALSWADLSFVLPATAFGYVLNVAAGYYFLNETVSPIRWAGAVIITAGRGVRFAVGRTDNAARRRTNERGNRWRMITALMIALVVLGSSIGDVLITKGMKEVGEISTLRPGALVVIAKRAITNKFFLAGVFFLAVSYFSFLAALALADLSLVVPATSIGFVINTIGAKFFLKERINSSMGWHSARLHRRCAHLSALMPTLTNAIVLILSGLTVAANAFYLLSIVAARRFFFGRKTDESGELPPVSIMIPLYGADFKAYHNYALFCRQDYPEFQIVFGVREREDSSIPIVQKLIADFPETRHCACRVSRCDWEQT